jgi:hypothetical protein
MHKKKKIIKPTTTNNHLLVNNIATESNINNTDHVLVIGACTIVFENF